MLKPHLFAIVLVLFCLIGLSATQTAAQCAPPVGCPPAATPYSPPSSDPNSGAGGNETWGGYTDGRMNAAPDEYYTIFCLNDTASVWARGQQVTAIPLADIVYMPDGSSGLSGQVQYTRTGDLVIFSGNDGNGMPNPGSKSISLSECIARNGRVPNQPPVNAGAENIQTFPTPESSQQLFWQAIENLCGINLTGGAAVVGVIPMLLRRRKRR